MERANIYITDNQKEWLLEHSVTNMAKRWKNEGTTMSDHVREALKQYINKMEE